MCSLVTVCCIFNFSTEDKEDLYGTRHQEAVKIFNALLSQENLADPIKQVQSVIQKCFDIQDLQSEASCVYRMFNKIWILT